MAGFKLTSDGDIGIDGNGKMLLLATKQELVKQRLQIELKTFKGEWWLDTSYGIPYRDTGDGKAIVGKGLTKKDIDAIYIATINNDPDVNTIEYFYSEYNAIQRAYNLSFEVKTDDELLMSINSSIPAWEEVTYLYSDTILSSSCNMGGGETNPLMYVYSGYIDENYVAP